MVHLICLILSVATVAQAKWQVDQPRPDVFVLQNETGAWGGFSMGVSHQNNPQYQVRKTLDLTALPETIREQAELVRLRLYCAIQDNSCNVENRTHNGLNESFEIMVNDTPMHFHTSDPRFPARGGPNDPLRSDWVDIDLPREVLKAETLDIVIRKLLSGNNDDYYYLGIDNSVPTTHSAVSFDGGKQWENPRLNAIDAKGEYIVRLVLSKTNLNAKATWNLFDAARDPLSPVLQPHHQECTMLAVCFCLLNNNSIQGDVQSWRESFVSDSSAPVVLPLAIISAFTKQRKRLLQH